MNALRTPFNRMILTTLKKYGWVFEGDAGALVTQSLTIDKKGNAINSLGLYIDPCSPESMRLLIDARRKAVRDGLLWVGSKRVHALKTFWLIDRWFASIGDNETTLTIYPTWEHLEVPEAATALRAINGDPAFVVAACSTWNLPQAADMHDMADNIHSEVCERLSGQLPSLRIGLDVARQRLSAINVSSRKTPRTLIREFNTKHYRVSVERVAPNPQMLTALDGTLLSHSGGEVPPESEAEYDRQVEDLNRGDREVFQFEVNLCHKVDGVDDVMHRSALFLLTPDELRSARIMRRLIRSVVSDVISEHQHLSVLNKPDTDE